MQKLFYISKSSADDGNSSVPAMDRFERIEKLNDLIALGWSIKDFRTEQSGEYFVLEKG